MKHSLTVLTLVVLAAVAVLAVVKGQGSGARTASISAGTSRSPGGTNAAAPADSATEISSSTTPSIHTARPVVRTNPQDGSVLLAEAAQHISKLPALETKLRLQASVLDESLVGSGTYYQLSRAPEMMFKLELKLPVANQVSSFLTVNDGRFLWTRRDLPTAKILGRIDLRRLHEAMIAAKREPPPSPGVNNIALGGLGKSLENIGGMFEFGPPEAIDVAGAPAWQITGQWRVEALANLLPQHAATIRAGQTIPPDQWPEQMPTHIVIALSRDASLGLFPYRIDYRRDGGAGEGSSMVLLEFFDIRANVDLDPRLFAYQPGDQEVLDQTEEWLKGMGL